MHTNLTFFPKFFLITTPLWCFMTCYLTAALNTLAFAKTIPSLNTRSFISVLKLNFGYYMSSLSPKDITILLSVEVAYALDLSTSATIYSSSFFPTFSSSFYAFSPWFSVFPFHFLHSPYICDRLHETLGWGGRRPDRF